ncbi:MAG: hypothetical protein WEB87_02820 [Bacteriovoracaceae bacterium]
MKQEANQEITVSNSMKNYISLAKTGHYPLFFEEWLGGSLKESKPMSFHCANKNVKALFKKLAKHQSVERKKTLLCGMENSEREEFIRSFFKVVERDILKDLKSLH